MAGCRKTTPNVPNEVKSYIRSVLLSKPKGIKVSQLLRDYNELVGEKLMYRKYGCASLEALLETMPDAARLAQVDGNQMIFGIPDSTSFQTISMKKASRALERLALPDGGSGDQPTKSSLSRNSNSGNGIRRNDAKKNSKNFRYGKRSSKSNKKQRDSDTDDPSMRISKFNKEGNEDLDLNDPILKEPRVQRWVDQLEMDQHGRYSLVIANIKNGFSEKQLMEDFSMYGNVVTTHQAMGLFFIRYQTKIEALRAMYNLKSNYDLRFGRKKKQSADVKVQEKSVENEQPPAVNGFTNGLNEVATVDICVENLPYDVGKAGISELLYLGGIPANIMGGQEIFNKPGNKSFAYLRVKGMENARKVVGALHKLEWREHTLTAKMPEHVAQPSQPIVLSPGAKRKILLQSAFAALQHDQNKCQRNDEESDYDDDDDDIRDMPDLEASAYEDDEMFKKRNYVSKEEENDDTEDDSDDDDDFFEMPELEAIPEFSHLSVSVKEDKPPLISSPPAKEASRVGSQQDLSPPCNELDRLHLQKQSPVKSPNRQEGKTNLTVKSPPSKATKDDESTESKLSSSANVILFKGGKTTLSNFYMFPLWLWDQKFPSAEHAYQFAKATIMGDASAAASIKNAMFPSMAKIIGGRVLMDRFWNKRRGPVMWNILEAKAQQCPAFRTELVDTYGHTLIEDTNNDFWGRGRYGEGQNVLGVMLMKIRDRLCTNNNCHM